MWCNVMCVLGVYVVRAVAVGSYISTKVRHMHIPTHTVHIHIALP
jgi:hypothetical protein